MTATDYIERIGFEKIQTDADFSKWQTIVSLAYLEVLFTEAERCLMNSDLSLEETLNAVDGKFLFNSAMREHHADPKYNYRKLVTGLYDQCITLPEDIALQSFQAVKENMTASICVYPEFGCDKETIDLSLQERVAFWEFLDQLSSKSDGYVVVSPDDSQSPK